VLLVRMVVPVVMVVMASVVMVVVGCVGHLVTRLLTLLLLLAFMLLVAAVVVVVVMTMAVICVILGLVLLLVVVLLLPWFLRALRGGHPMQHTLLMRCRAGVHPLAGCERGFCRPYLVLQGVGGPQRGRYPGPRAALMLQRFSAPLRSCCFCSVCCGSSGRAATHGRQLQAGGGRGSIILHAGKVRGRGVYRVGEEGLTKWVGLLLLLLLLPM